MSYLNFLIIFLGIPLAFLIPFYKLSKSQSKKEFFWGIVVLIILAVTYTTPWDNYLVATKVWWYGPDRVLGTIGYVPIEEYSFFVLQTIMTGLWCYFLQSKITLNKSQPRTNPMKKVITTFYFAIFALGVYGLFVENLTYLGLILAWATPVLLLQWIIGGQYLIQNLKLFLLTFIPPTLYLWLADAYAIHDQIWSISEIFTTGIKIVNLPIEEAIFFLVTNLMVAQGLILFVVMEKEVEKVLNFKRRLFA